MIKSEAEAAQIIKDIEAASGNPVKIIEIIKKAGESSGMDIVQLFNKIQSEKRPNETIEQAFKRLLSAEKR